MAAETTRARQARLGGSARASIIKQCGLLQRHHAGVAHGVGRGVWESGGYNPCPCPPRGGQHACRTGFCLPHPASKDVAAVLAAAVLVVDYRVPVFVLIAVSVPHGGVGP
eukprot:Rmarinus@m.11384